MKEKTFEEILEDYMAYESMSETQKIFVKNMMQKVCEATKAECMRIYEDDWGKYTGYKLMEALPTDRIKIEK